MEENRTPVPVILGYVDPGYVDPGNSPVCPKCGAEIKVKWSGVECSKRYNGCDWWFCL